MARGAVLPWTVYGKVWPTIFCAAEADFASGFNDRDPTTYQANFKPLPRQVCAECHTSAKAGDKCLSCHNYHLGIYQPVEAHTSGMLKQASNKP